MDKKLILKTLIGWLGLAILAIINGSIRNYLYKPYLGDLLAHQISTIIFVMITFLFSFILFRTDFNKCDAKKFITVGIIWFFLTEAFEFLAGHYLFGNSWEKIFADYNLFAGRVWLVALIFILLSPYLLWLLKNR